MGQRQIERLINGEGLLLPIERGLEVKEYYTEDKYKWVKMER